MVNTHNILHIGGLIDFENGGNICAIILVLRIQIIFLSLHTFRICMHDCRMMIKLTSCDYDKRLFKYHQIYENVEFYGAVVYPRGVWCIEFMRN